MARYMSLVNQGLDSNTGKIYYCQPGKSSVISYIMLYTYNDKHFNIDSGK